MLITIYKMTWCKYISFARSQHRRQQRVYGWRYQRIWRQEKEEEASSQSHHFHQLPTRRAGEGLQRGPLSGRVRSRNAVDQNRPARRPNTGKLYVTELYRRICGGSRACRAFRVSFELFNYSIVTRHSTVPTGFLYTYLRFFCSFFICNAIRRCVQQSAIFVYSVCK